MTPIIQSLSELVRINSVNAFYEGGPGEADVADYLIEFFRHHSIETVLQPVLEATSCIRPRQNVIARLPGQNNNRRVLLEAHMDTVSVQGMTIPPFDATIQDGKMYGRGTCDTKAGLAAMMHALVDIKQRGIIPPCEILLAAVVDEEFSFRGVAKLADEYRADAAIVAEPTELRLVTASKGVLRWRIVSRGKAAHSSKCHLGVNAITKMTRLIHALDQDDHRLRGNVHPLLGAASCNVGKIHGGVQVNFVPDECVIELDRRMIPGESVQQVLSEYEAIIQKLRDQDPALDIRMEPPMLIDEPWTVDVADPVVTTAIKTLESLGLDSSPAGVPFGSDASKLGRAGIATIIYGPGSIDQAHSAEEYIELDQVEQAFDFYRQFLLHYA